MDISKLYEINEKTGRKQLIQATHQKKQLFSKSVSVRVLEDFAERDRRLLDERVVYVKLILRKVAHRNFYTTLRKVFVRVRSAKQIQRGFRDFIKSRDESLGEMLQFWTRTENRMNVELIQKWRESQLPTAPPNKDYIWNIYAGREVVLGFKKEIIKALYNDLKLAFVADWRHWKKENQHVFKAEFLERIKGGTTNKKRSILNNSYAAMPTRSKPRFEIGHHIFLVEKTAKERWVDFLHQVEERHAKSLITPLNLKSDILSEVDSYRKKTKAQLVQSARGEKSFADPLTRRRSIANGVLSDLDKRDSTDSDSDNSSGSDTDSTNEGEIQQQQTTNEVQGLPRRRSMAPTEAMAIRKLQGGADIDARVARGTGIRRPSLSSAQFEAMKAKHGTPEKVQELEPKKSFKKVNSKRNLKLESSEFVPTTINIVEGENEIYEISPTINSSSHQGGGTMDSGTPSSTETKPTLRRRKSLVHFTTDSPTESKKDTTSNSSGTSDDCAHGDPKFKPFEFKRSRTDGSSVNLKGNNNKSTVNTNSNNKENVNRSNTTIKPELSRKQSAKNVHDAPTAPKTVNIISSSSGTGGVGNLTKDNAQNMIQRRKSLSSLKSANISKDNNKPPPSTLLTYEEFKASQQASKSNTKEKESEKTSGSGLGPQHKPSAPTTKPTLTALATLSPPSTTNSFSKEAEAGSHKGIGTGGSSKRPAPTTNGISRNPITTTSNARSSSVGSSRSSPINISHLLARIDDKPSSSTPPPGVSGGQRLASMSTPLAITKSGNHRSHSSNTAPPSRLGMFDCDDVGSPYFVDISGGANAQQRRYNKATSINSTGSHMLPNVGIAGSGMGGHDLILKRNAKRGVAVKGL